MKIKKNNLVIYEKGIQLTPKKNRKIINREAHAQAKGFRLQKLRAIQLVLSKVEVEEAWVYCAIEYEGDVYLHSSTSIESADYTEENKNYRDSSFSMNSAQVVKTLIGFIDTWIEHDYSKKHSFGFLTTATIAKEKETVTTKKLSLQVPFKPVLGILSRKEKVDEVSLIFIKSIIIDAYKKAYGVEPENEKNRCGYLDEISDFTDDDWENFLKCIEWKFGSEDEIEIEKKIVENIRNARFYTADLDGKENLIIARLIYELDKRQALPDFADRFINLADVKLIFKEVQSGEWRVSDPAWEAWNDIQKPIDKRNLEEKIRAVCNAEEFKNVGNYCRRVALSRYEEKAIVSNDRSWLSIKYRIYCYCIEELQKIVSNKKGGFLPDEISGVVEKLTQGCIDHLSEVAKSFAFYPINKDLVEGILLELIDSCFLSFDGGESIE